MGQKQAKPRHQQLQQSPQDVLLHFGSGLVPRSEAARRSCELRRVAELIQSDRLAPCWDPLNGDRGHECPVCMENYAKLNHTGCCHQDICTECFITIVAPSGASRCPYCQSEALQVYLPKSSRDSGKDPVGADSSQQAAAPAAQHTTVKHAGKPPLPPAHRRLRQQQQRQQAALQRAASSGFFICGGAEFATASSRTLPAVQADIAGNSSACSQVVGPLCSPGGSTPAAFLLLRTSLSSLAEAAARASQHRPPQIVGMVLTRGAPPPPHRSTSTSTGTGTTSAGSSSSRASPKPPADVACTAAAAAAAPGLPGLASPASGPALLLNPDGTAQLVLLRSAADEQAARQQQQQKQQAPQGEQPVPSYQAPATPEDERMRAAIARSDAALRRQRVQPPSAAQLSAGDAPAADWLARMQAADAALRQAVARNDEQRFAGGTPSSS